MNPITSAASGTGGRGFGGGTGPFVVPGTYTVSLAKRVDGVASTLGELQSFEVYLLDGNRTPRSATVLAFQQQAASLQRAVLGANAALGEATTRIELLERALHETPNADPQLVMDLRRLADSAQGIQDELNGDPTARRRQEPAPPSLLSRLGNITGGAWSSSLQTVTGTQRRQYELRAAEVGAILERLRSLIDLELKRIEDAAEAAGAPWTSGRVPTWRP
jgi:hypothetical protein